ncbi:MAG: hypothetical protein ACREID_07930 [Planctomycetota bacterium]
MRATAFTLVLLCEVAGAGEEKGSVEERLERLERQLAEEKARAERSEGRIRELEEALRKATDALARSHDRRQLEEEIEAYLREREPAERGLSPLSRLHIGAVIVASYRATEFAGPSPRTNTFQVEERYLRFVYRFSDHVTARYYTDGSLAELEVRHSDPLQLNVGVIVVPFGQFNARSFPDTFDTLSRPLLYLGDEDTFTSPPNHPRPVFRSLYSDTGVALSGNLWRGENQLSYAAYVTNGLVGVGVPGQDASFSDNNQNKQLGARVSYTASGWLREGRVGVGFSALTGKFDSGDALSYRMYGADFLIAKERLFRRGEGSLVLRGEYVFSPREIAAGTLGDPSTLINDASRVQGAYLLLEARLDRSWMVYTGADWLSQRAPLLTGGLIDPADQDPVTSRILRGTAGVVYRFSLGIVWKLEYAFWDFDRGAPDAHRLSTQLVIPF